MCLTFPGQATHLCRLIFTFFAILFLKLNDICFTEFCSFLSHIKNQPQVLPCPLLPEHPFHLPHHSTLLDCHRAPV